MSLPAPEPVQPVAGKARAITKAVSLLSSLRHDPQANGDRIRELVDTINSLLIPTGWVGIDSEGRFHLTYVAREDDRARYVHLDGSEFGTGRPASLAHHADFTWEYSSLDRTVRCVKCRDGTVSDGATFSCADRVQLHL